MTEYQNRRLRELVDEYIRSRSKTGSVSVSAASRAVTTIMSDCPLADDDLENMIAWRAIENGHSVLLDGSVDRLSKPAPMRLAF
jgi:hypothetical protein